MGAEVGTGLGVGVEVGLVVGAVVLGGVGGVEVRVGGGVRVEVVVFKDSGNTGTIRIGHRRRDSRSTDDSIPLQRAPQIDACMALLCFRIANT